MESDAPLKSARIHNEYASLATFSGYFPRRLTLNDDSLQDNRVSESGLLALPGNKIILGDPGMGKSELIRELGRRLGVEPITAMRFISSKSPAKLVLMGMPVLIDALDEAMSRRDGDAVDAILAQLEEADSPPFILSCRSRAIASDTRGPV